MPVRQGAGRDQQQGEQQKEGRGWFESARTESLVALVPVHEDVPVPEEVPVHQKVPVHQACHHLHTQPFV